MERVNQMLKKAFELECQAEELRAEAKVLAERIQFIEIDTLFFDEELKETMRVTKLKNGSNDFEAVSLNGKQSRGYHYSVSNWSKPEHIIS